MLCVTASAQADEFLFQKGELPILVVAPHGGSDPLPKAAIRSKTEVTDPHFTRSKDLVTAELAQQLYNSFPAGGKPSILISRIHRKFVDHNRKETWSTHDPNGRAAHRRFHQTLEGELQRLISLHGRALLLDIHGQGKLETDIILGTREGKTISDWSRPALWGSDGLIAILKETGYSVLPNAEEDKIRYNGGYIVRHYSKDPNVDAWQIEHSKQLRYDRERNIRYTSLLAKHLTQYLRDNR